MKLQRLQATGFRSIGETLDLEVHSPMILAGHNDAGKSALIDAVAFLLGEQKLDDRDRTYASVGDDGSFTRVSETVVEGSFRLSSDEQNDLGLPEIVRVRRVYREGSTFLEALTTVPSDENLRNPNAQTVTQLKSILNTYGQPDDGLKPALVERVSAYAASAPMTEQWTTAPSDLSRALPKPQRFDATSTQNPEAAILSVLKSSYQAHLADETISGSVRTLTKALEDLVIADAADLREHIKAKCSDIGDITISPSVTLDGGLKATEVSARNERGEVVHLGQSGAGRARRIALAVWEFNARLLSGSGVDTVLLYDEPDTHLDYRHQRGFMRLLAEQAALPNVQIVVATHSMNLIDGVDIANVVHLQHVESRTRAAVIVDDSEIGKHLGSIAASLGLRNTVLLHERIFVGVEGDTESRAFPVLFKLATGMQLQSCGIAIWPCGNNDGALRFAQYLYAHDREVLLVVDQDSRDQKQFSDANLQRCGLVPEKHLLTVGVREFEDTFSDEQWAACANDSWPREDGQEWTAEQFAKHRESKFSSKVERMIREEGSVEISGKPDIMVALALSLREPSDVPEQLRNLFQELINRAK